MRRYSLLGARLRGRVRSRRWVYSHIAVCLRWSVHLHRPRSVCLCVILCMCANLSVRCSLAFMRVRVTTCLRVYVCLIHACSYFGMMTHNVEVNIFVASSSCQTCWNNITYFSATITACLLHTSGEGRSWVNPRKTWLFHTVWAVKPTVTKAYRHHKLLTVFKLLKLFLEPSTPSRPSHVRVTAPAHNR